MPDLNYWTVRAKSKESGLYNRITPSNSLSPTLLNSPALADALEKRSNLEKQFKESQELAIKLEGAIALLKDALPLPANKGGAIKEKIKEALLLLENNNFRLKV